MWRCYLSEVAASRMIVEDVQGDQDDINSPPDTAETSSDELEDTEEDVAKIETIDAYKCDV